MAQTFTAQTTGSLVRGEIEVSKPVGGADWVMEILATAATGYPTNTMLASTTIPDATLPPIGPFRLVGTFASPASVQAGQQYAISLRRFANWTIRDRSDNPCPGVAFFSFGPAEAWIDATGGFGTDDLVFAVFVEPAPPPEPEPQPKADRTLTLDANKNKVTKRKKVLLSGQLDSPEQACESGQAVELQRKRPKHASFTTFGQLQSDAQGNFSLKNRLKKTLEFRAQVPETATCASQVSNTEKVRVKRKK